MDSTALLACAATLLGAITGSLAACVPSLHAFTVLTAALWIVEGSALAVPVYAWIAFTAALLSAWALLSAIPSIFLAATDEGLVFSMPTAQQYLRRGRGAAAVQLIAAGALGGTLVTCLAIGLTGGYWLPVLHRILRPHTHWVVWCVIAYLVLSEWSREGTRGPGGWQRLQHGWRPLLAGMATFGFSALLGCILLFRSPLDTDAAFHTLLPAFTGLFGTPWLILNLLRRQSLPEQIPAPPHASIHPQALLRGVGSGVAGGAFAALFPAVTGGVGALLAGQASAERDDRAYLISQGANRTTYYLGAFLMFFVPGLQASRGGAAALLGTLYQPGWVTELWLAAGAALAGAAWAGLLCPGLCRLAARGLGRADNRLISAGALAVMTALVGAITHGEGLLILLTATAIGLIPVVYGSRRLNALAVILVPMALKLSGYGTAAAWALGLLP